MGKVGRGGAPSFLVVSMRYLGDVLLSTPLALSIMESMPDASVDYLVLPGGDSILEKNPSVRAVYTMPPGSRSVRDFLGRFRRYDYAIGANPSDRTAISAIGAGKTSVGFSYFSRKEWWKRRLYDECRLYDDRVHAVPLILSLLEAVRIPPVPRVVMGFDEEDRRIARECSGNDGYVLFHPYARKEYKYWPPECWGALARLVSERMGLVPVFSVSPSPADRPLLDRILEIAPRGTRTLGRVLSLPQLAAAISGGRAFVGVDTVVTHMAAALEVPTVAIFGPTWVHHWGPWPNGETSAAPYDAKGRVQRRGRIAVVQKDWPCVPCNQEWCALSRGGSILCLETLSPEEVFEEFRLVVERGKSG